MAVVRSVGRMLARAGPILARLPQGALMVEVGVSTALLAEHLLRTRPDLEWHGVDPWAPRSQQRACYVASGDIHAALADHDTLEHMTIALQRVRPFGDRAVVLRAWSPQVTEWYGPETVDLCYLDSDHSLEGVRVDIRAWWPIIKRGGYLSGHDYANPDPRFNFGVKQAVDEWVAEIGLPLELETGLCWFVQKPP